MRPSASYSRRRRMRWCCSAMLTSWKKSANARKHGGLPVVIERGDRLSERVARASGARVAGERPDPLLVVEQLLALLLDEHAPEQVTEQADVGAESGVGGHVRTLEKRATRLGFPSCSATDLPECYPTQCSITTDVGSPGATTNPGGHHVPAPPDAVPYARMDRIRRATRPYAEMVSRAVGVQSRHRGALLVLLRRPERPAGPDTCAHATRRATSASQRQVPGRSAPRQRSSRPRSRSPS